MILLAPVAAAADPSPTLLLPSAAPAPAGTAELGLSFGHGTLSLLGTDTVAIGSSLRAGWAPSDAVWLEAGLGGDVRSAESCGLFPGGACADPETFADGGLSLSARYRAPMTDGLAVAPFAGAFLVGGGRRTGPAVGGALGLAVEGGGRRVRGDLSLGLAAGVADGRFDGLPVGEGGVTFLLGSGRRHALRIGLAELVPDLSWRCEADRWFLGAGVSGVPFAAGAERLEVGWRF